ncbi:MAG: glycosyltransferase [Lachnospiraceae bacterium]|nr:glycosyltransferase [Lachnospiraceae bacterium]
MFSENDSPLISVLIPVYNAEKYIGRCIESVQKQEYSNIELILIDDGSTDQSGKICDRYAENDSRIKVFHEKNHGVAVSRNKALDNASGDYLIFVDADDHINSKMITELYRNMTEYNADMSICSYKESSSCEFTAKDIETSVDTISGADKFTGLFGDEKLSFIVPWGRLYKKELFEGLRYPDGKIHEDEYIAHYLLDRAKKITYNKAKLYCYFKEDEGNSSITQSLFSMKRLDCIGALEDRLEFFKKYANESLLEKTYDDFLKRFQYYYYGVKYQFKDKADLAEKLFLRYKELYREGKKYLSSVSRVRYALFIYMPTINYHLKNMMKSKSIRT